MSSKKGEVMELSGRTWNEDEAVPALRSALADVNSGLRGVPFCGFKRVLAVGILLAFVDDVEADAKQFRDDLAVGPVIPSQG
jgi:hypothetical protein